MTGFKYSFQFGQQVISHDLELIGTVVFDEDGEMYVLSKSMSTKNKVQLTKVDHELHDWETFYTGDYGN